MKAVQNAKLTLEIDTSRNWDETFRLISWWDSEKIMNAKVMVVGAGALGNEVLKNLALLNVGNILIVDFDTIEYSNLSRSVLFREADCAGNQLKCEVAAKRIQEINPNIKVQTINGDILLDVGLGVFRRMDVVIGCLDNRLARLFINRYCHKTGRTWVDGAIENLAGQLDVYKPSVSCYECQMTDVERQMIRYRLGCPDIAMRNLNMGKIPTTPISSSIIAAMQVQEALKVIYGNWSQSLAGQRFVYEGMNLMMLQYPNAELQEECESHSLFEPLIEAPELSCDTTIGDFLNWAIRYFGDPDPIIHLGYEVVEEITTYRSGITYPVLLAKLHLSEKVAEQYRKIPGEDLVITKSSARISKKFERQDAPLRQLGVPPLQILTVEANGGYHYVELSADEPFLQFQ